LPLAQAATSIVAATRVVRRALTLPTPRAGRS
jgi:hypothetical protein